jgi:hypothetical protein
MTGPTLVDFLRARLDEDEADLRESNISDMPEWWAPAAWSRARGLADVKAKRAIVELRAALSQMDRTDDRWEAGQIQSADFAVRALASPYADHPDYDATWSV